MFRKPKRIIFFLFVLSLLSVGAFAQKAKSTESGESGKKVVRIGVLLPNVKLKQASGEISPDEALRNSYGALLNSDLIQVVPIEARLTSLALDEAKKKHLDYILNINLTQEEKKSSGGILGKVARDAGTSATWEAAMRVPGGGKTGTRIARSGARSAIVNSGYTLSNMAVEVKKNDKFVLAYHMTDAKGESLIDKSLTGKATKNSDDKVLVDMIEKSAEEIAKVVIKK